MKDLLEEVALPRKKLVLMHILSILQKHTDASHTMTVEDIRERRRHGRTL